MQTKLTLRLDSNLVKRAKSLAKRTGKSVSRIVADYFTVLDASQLKEKGKTWTPLVHSLKGSLRKTRVTEKEYRRYLEAKYR